MLIDHLILHMERSSQTIARSSPAALNLFQLIFPQVLKCGNKQLIWSSFFIWGLPIEPFSTDFSFSVVAKVEFHISAKVLQVLIPYFSWPLLLLNSLSLYPHKNIEVFSFLKIDCKTYYFVFFKLENISAPIFCCYSNDQDV